MRAIRRAGRTEVALTRRQTLLTGAAALGATAAAPVRSGLGVQLFSFSALLAQGEPGLMQAMETARRIGFESVEPPGLRGVAPEVVRRRAEALGLGIPSFHMGNDQVLAVRTPGLSIQDAQDIVYTPEGVVQVARVNLPLARDLGCRWAVIAAAGRSNFRSRETVLRLCDAFNSSAKLAAAQGLGLSYHMHAPDFAPVDGVAPFQTIIEQTDPAIRYQLDVCWAAAGGTDPAALIRDHAARLVSLHLKDLAADRRTPTLPGEGVLDFRAIHDAARLIHDPLFYVERDGPPSRDQTRDVQQAFSALSPFDWRMTATRHARLSERFHPCV
jgi:sugar phosphate isomerase/epimerase